LKFKPIGNGDVLCAYELNYKLFINTCTQIDKNLTAPLSPSTLPFKSTTYSNTAANRYILPSFF